MCYVLSSCSKLKEPSMYTFNLNDLIASACHSLSRATQTKQEECLYFSTILFPQNFRIETPVKLQVFSPLLLSLWESLILALGMKSWAALPAQ